MSPAWVRFLVYNTGLVYTVQVNWSGPTDSGSTENARLENRKLFKILFKLLYYVFHRCRFVLAFSVAPCRELTMELTTVAARRCRVLHRGLGYKSASTAVVKTFYRRQPSADAQAFSGHYSTVKHKALYQTQTDWIDLVSPRGLCASHSCFIRSLIQ